MTQENTTRRDFLQAGAALSGAALLAGGVYAAGGDEIRVGLIGLDTSHAVAFTQLLNDPARPDHVPGARVVAAFKQGSPDVEASATGGAPILARNAGRIAVAVSCPNRMLYKCTRRAKLTLDHDGVASTEKIDPILDLQGAG